MNILQKQKVSMDEMKEAYLSTQSPFEPNQRRIGQFAKQNGYILTKQMINRKVIRFYVKQNQKV